MIKILALDLDGTLLGPGGIVSDENRAAIRRAEDLGVLVTIATGRRFRDAEPVGVGLGLNAPLISHNGALLKYAGTLETVYGSLHTAETSKEIIRVGKEFGGDALVSADPLGRGTLYYDRVSAANLPLQKYLAWSRTVHGPEADEAVHQVDDLVSILPDHQIIHISFSGSCASMYDMQRVLEEELAGTVTILATIYPQRDFTLIDILPPDASKGAGLQRLADFNNIDREEVMAIGDNYNDIEMLEFAGTPVLMGNADPELIARPDVYTTLTNEENGVAAAIERFILGENER